MCEVNGNSLRQNEIKKQNRNNINLFFLNKSGSLISVCSLISASCFTDRLRQTSCNHFSHWQCYSLSIRRSDLAAWGRCRNSTADVSAWVMQYSFLSAVVRHDVVSIGKKSANLSLPRMLYTISCMGNSHCWGRELLILKWFLDSVGWIKSL